VDKGRKENASRIAYEIHKEIKLLIDIFSSVLNKDAPIENLVKAIENFKRKRQLLNNLNIGMIIGIKNVVLATFKLTGDLEKDLNQRNLSKEDIDENDK